MKKSFFIFLLVLPFFSATAQVNQILGNWKTIDDKSGEPQSIVNIYKGSDGLYYGKICLENGNLVLRGSLDKRGFLGRNQTWLRVK